MCVYIYIAILNLLYAYTYYIYTVYVFIQHGLESVSIFGDRLFIIRFFFLRRVDDAIIVLLVFMLSLSVLVRWFK